MCSWYYLQQVGIISVIFSIFLMLYTNFVLPLCFWIYLFSIPQLAVSGTSHSHVDNLPTPTHNLSGSCSIKVPFPHQCILVLLQIPWHQPWHCFFLLTSVALSFLSNSLNDPSLPAFIPDQYINFRFPLLLTHSLEPVPSLWVPGLPSWGYTTFSIDKCFSYWGISLK